ncbi:MerR family transcriptional regulator [Actinokineospora sp. 24-640]
MSSAEGGGPMWTAGAVARELRIADSTLRTWHRRYGLGPAAPRPGQYRRYSSADIARLRRMRDLIAAGVLPSEAARRVTDPGESAPTTDILAEVLAAARALDNAQCAGAVERALGQWGVIDAWEQVCRPALAAVDPERIDCEHVLSWAISTALRRLDRPTAAAAVLLTCTDDEQHTLPLEALAAALAEHDTPVRMLGAAVPTATLAQAAVSAEPRAVVLWSQRPETARPEAVRALLRRRVRALIAGPGWRRRPAGAEHVHSLRDAVTALRDVT